MKKSRHQNLFVLALASLALSSCMIHSSESSSNGGGTDSSSASTIYSSSSSVASSSSNSSNTASSGKNASSSSSSSSQASGSSSWAPVPYPTQYRVAPKMSHPDSRVLNVYNVSFTGASFVGSTITSLTKGTYYTSYQDVAAYWIGFGELPVNYVCADGDNSSSCKDTKNKWFPTYGEDTRLWFTYSRTNGYMTQVPAYNGSTPKYFEFDISGNWNSYKSNRGALRLMAMPNGVQNYGSDPVIFYTDDHYDHFIEYYNHDYMNESGWGPSFASRGDYVKPETVISTY